MLLIDKNEKIIIVWDWLKNHLVYDFSKASKNIENKINAIIGRFKNDSNTYLIPLLTTKKDLIILLNELMTEFR